MRWEAEQCREEHVAHRRIRYAPGRKHDVSDLDDQPRANDVQTRESEHLATM